MSTTASARVTKQTENTQHATASSSRAHHKNQPLYLKPKNFVLVVHSRFSISTMCPSGRRGGTSGLKSRHGNSLAVMLG